VIIALSILFWRNKHQCRAFRKEIATEMVTSKSLKRYLDLITERIIIMHIDLDGTISKVSNAYENIFKFSTDELLGQKIDKQAYSPSRADKPIWKILEEEHCFNGEMQLKASTGDTYWMYKQIVEYFDDDGAMVGYIAISHDITANKLYEEQQKFLIDQSRHAVMGEMIAMIAHQWRQPLATIGSVVSNLHLDIELGSSSPKTLEEGFDKIEQIVEHLSHTVSDFRNFFKSDNEKKMTNISLLFSQATELIAFKLRGIQVDIQADSAFELAIHPSEMLQVLLNLLNNAADALREQQMPTIRMMLRYDDEQVHIMVSDNGVGIDEAIINQIFDPYFSTKSKNGTGLGLYIAKIITEKHLNGSIVANNLTQGCRMSITIPRSKES